MNSLSEAAASLSIGSAISIHFIKGETGKERQRERDFNVEKKKSFLFQCLVVVL